MLAVFEKTKAKIPESQSVADLAYDHVLRTDEPTSAFKDRYLANIFEKIIQNALVIDRKPYCTLCTSPNWTKAEVPGFGHSSVTKDDITCILRGQIVNCPDVMEQNGMEVGDSNAVNLINAYKELRAHNAPAEAKWFQVVEQLRGNFAFIVSDFTEQTFFATSTSIYNDTAGNNLRVTLYWGTDKSGNLILSDQEYIAMKGCGLCYAELPSGYFIMSGKGIRSYDEKEDELLLQAELDIAGTAYGINFEMDEHKRPLKRARTGSSAFNPAGSSEGETSVPMN